MKPICLLLLVCAPAAARADVVLEWNETALATIRRTSTPPPAASRALAMVHVAIYDAVNSIEPTHQPFRVYLPDSPATSREAAAAQAAFHVLSSLYPAERGVLEGRLSQSLTRVPDGPGKAAGVFLGNAVAERIIAWRANDGSQSSVSYKPGSQPGEWRPTLPRYEPALMPHWPKVAPLAIASASQFRAAFPPDLKSAEYARDLREVKDLGNVTSSLRTADQTEIAHYWADGAGTVTPPGHWNRIAQTVARSSGLSLPENARLFALLNAALADAAIVCWDMKFACNFWRPITAIHEADRDGNDQTEPDRAWRPLLATPPFPTCTSGHSTFSGAAAEILALFFGRDDVQFADTSESGRRRSFVSFTQAAQEAGRSRIFGGIHFEFDNHTGLESGRNVARYIFRNAMQARGTSPSLASRQTYRPAMTMAAGSMSALDDSGWRPASNVISESAPVVTYYQAATYGAVTAYSPIQATPMTSAAIVNPLGHVIHCDPQGQAYRPIITLPEPAVTYSIVLP